MAIDMIEDNELGALSSSRLGNKTFIDDSRYANLSFRSHKYFERKRASSFEQAYAIDPTKEKDCDYLQQGLIEIQNSIEAEYNKNPNKKNAQILISPMRDAEKNFRNAIAKAKCIQTEEQLQRDTDEKKTLDAINKASESTTSLLSTTDAQDKSKTTKYIIYGVGGLIVVVSLIALLKRK
jgi:hypothetical protein